jgi:outer membrane protein assembly factor BamD
MRARLATRSALALLPALLLSLGCASSRVSITGELKYGKTAEENYEAGVDELKHENWVEGIKFLEYVRSKYPFSKYAALAELRIADAKLSQERFVEAAEAYGAFVQLHPTHEEADYAEFRAALARFRDAPAEFLLFPPAHEKDQRSLVTSVGLLQAFLKNRPESKHRAEAEKLLAEAQGRLSAHEWYVAEFYWKRERWAGATGRLEGLLKQYPGSKHEGEALWRLGYAYSRMDEAFRARQALQRLIATHPQDPRRPEAEALLARLR